MSEFKKRQKQVSEARAQCLILEDRARAIRNQLTQHKSRLNSVLRLGASGKKTATFLQDKIRVLDDSVRVHTARLAAAKDNLRNRLKNLTGLSGPKEQIEEWDDDKPILLFPVRIETRFVPTKDGKELWVRIFPDDISIHTHESELTIAEIVDGREFWVAHAEAAKSDDEKTRQEKEKGAWRALTGEHGGSRASWIAAQTRSEITEEEKEHGNRFWGDVNTANLKPDEVLRREGIDSAWFRLSKAVGSLRANWVAADCALEPGGDAKLAGEAFWQKVVQVAEADPVERKLIETEAWLALRGSYDAAESVRILLETRPDARSLEDAVTLIFLLIGSEVAPPHTWSRAPRSYVMPDRFAVILKSQDRLLDPVYGKLIPNPLVVGPDPSADEPDLRQKDGDITVGSDISWMHKFGDAVEIGMGFRIKLDPPYDTQGFDQLFVVGLRMSADADESRLLVEELIENHHHSAEGAGLVPQGTPTNNTGDTASGFFSRETDPEKSLSVETGPPLFSATTDPFLKSDGQRLADALGLSYQAFEHLEYADRKDISESRAMNQALWPATLGYYLEQKLDLDPEDVRQVERWCIDNVSGRASLPAIRIGRQPYGVLVTSSFSDWDFEEDGGYHREPINHRIYRLIQTLQPEWSAHQADVSHVGKAGNAHEHLMNILGLHATSTEFFRRHAVGSDFLFNYAKLVGEDWLAENTWKLHRAFVGELMAELGWQGKELPSILDLTYFSDQDRLYDALIDDVGEFSSEIFSEEQAIKRKYGIEGQDQPVNYIEWLLGSAWSNIRNQIFKEFGGNSVTQPSSLLYRLLRHGLLMANVDAAFRLYEDYKVIDKPARKQVELSNMGENRTVTQWEYLDARVDHVLPDLTGQRLSMHEFLASESADALPQISSLSQVREAMGRLVDLPTARLERLLAEHVDLCSYRLDAWQSGFFSERLENLRRGAEADDPDKRELGLYLGAFGWLEEVRPSENNFIPVKESEIPKDLRNLNGQPLLEQINGGGFIHGPSLNHAMTGAVLRNAYMTHAEPEDRDRMAVDLSSERVRLAKQLLDGVGNGQPLGALLGYRFERNLVEKHNDPSLAAFIPNFRDKYPLRADLITPDDEENSTELKEARNVFDGYQLLEVTFLADEPLRYPYGVEGLPASGSKAAAIKAEVDRMAWMLDAVKDLSLAEGVFQATQGNHDRAGAMMKAVSQGTHPPEPEIVKTPRSGLAINQRVALHFDVNAPEKIWTENGSARSKAEAPVNAWLGDVLGKASDIRYAIQYEIPSGDPDIGPTIKIDDGNSIADLKIEPIDLVQMVIGRLKNDDSELAKRMRSAYREKHPNLGSAEKVSVQVVPRYVSDSWVSHGHRSLHSMLPMILAIKRLVTTARSLASDDYRISLEAGSQSGAADSQTGYDLNELKTRVNQSHASLAGAVTRLEEVFEDAKDFDPNTQPDEQNAAYEALCKEVSKLAAFGVAGAFIDHTHIPPREARDGQENPFINSWNLLLEQVSSVIRKAKKQLKEANKLKEFEDLTDQQKAVLNEAEILQRYTEAGRQVLGAGFQILPRFKLNNKDELAAAQQFRERPIDEGLFRSSENRFVVDEWLQGIAKVRERMTYLDEVLTFAEVFGTAASSLKALQLPYRETDYWISTEYPNEYGPEGDFLSIVQILPKTDFDVNGSHKGLLIDAWTEVIPGDTETTGIAFNYNQPNSEPPQVLMLAVPPKIRGSWKWDDLLSILQDSLNRAKQRAVEPDQLDNHALAQFLPAILTPTTSNPDATISAPLDFQTAKGNFMNSGNRVERSDLDN